MAARDGRIGAMMGGVSRGVGNDTADLGALERRRVQAEKLQRAGPQVPFAEVLASAAGPGTVAPPRGRRGQNDGFAGGGQPSAAEASEEAEAKAAAGAPEAPGVGARSAASSGAAEVRRGGPRPRGRAPLLRG